MVANVSKMVQALNREAIEIGKPGNASCANTPGSRKTQEAGKPGGKH